MIITLSERERDWLRNMPAWTKAINGVSIEAKFDAIVVQYKELKEEAELWENRYEELLQAVGGVWPS